MNGKTFKILLVTALAGSLAAPVFADGGHGNHGKPEKHQTKQKEIMVHAKVNSVDVDARKINVSHGAIKQLSWPAMTMDMKVADNVDLKSVKAGQELMIALKRGDDGIYLINKLMMH